MMRLRVVPIELLLQRPIVVPLLQLLGRRRRRRRRDRVVVFVYNNIESCS